MARDELTMAKAVLPLANLPALRDGRPTDRTYRELENRFLKALASD